MKYELEEEIIHFVFKVFHGMKRKKEDIELSFHSIMVGNMLKNYGCDQITVYIGYLHDIIEDTKYTYEDLLKKYGKDIANGVLNLTENKNILDYLERKKDFLKRIKELDENILLIEVADKLQNLISDYDMYLEKGKDYLVTESNNYSESKWYYSNLKKIFNQRLKSNKLLNRFNKIVEEYFNI